VESRLPRYLEVASLLVDDHRMANETDRLVWTCPYCQHLSTLTDEDRTYSLHPLLPKAWEGELALVTKYIVCPNPKCRHYSLSVSIHWFQPQMQFRSDYDSRLGQVVKTWTLVPASNAKAFPHYVPQTVREDYEQACLIRELSPKASATLARRALQGMIRDFWGVRENRLIDEIEVLRDKVDSMTWEAIDALRRIGNIGAHMEKDVNEIIDVAPDEATKLISLIEFLVQDWYVTRAEKEARLRELAKIGASKRR
jgi:uncharacterized protein DUF4145